MATNCYNLAFPIEVCVDGPVGNGQTANMTVLVTGDTTNLVDLGQIGSVPNWDGSTVVVSGWANVPWVNCAIVSASISVTLVDADQVQVTFQGQVDDCPSGDIYNACGDEGPHTFTDTRIINMTGAPCSF